MCLSLKKFKLVFVPSPLSFTLFNALDIEGFPFLNLKLVLITGMFCDVAAVNISVFFTTST